MSERIEGFSPIVFEDSEVLLLGTLPGEKSLQKQYYYADNKNYFWDFFCEYTGRDKKPKSNEEAVDILKELKVALWDIYKSGIRSTTEKKASSKTEKKTSRDSDIKDPEWNDISGFLQQYPNIKRVGVMGKEAQKEFKKKYPEIKVEDIPSTSGGNGRDWGGRPIDRSRNGWTRFKEFIEQDI